MEPRVAVLDVGKTNVRLCAVDARGRAAAVLSRPNAARRSPPYPHVDADAIFAWIRDGLAALAREHAIDAIVPVAHGACGALVAGRDLALPILDYEFDGPGRLSHYDRRARRFAETRSPGLPFGLNLGRQLAWLAREFPTEFARADALLTHPGYWAFRLCGVPSCEVTSLGCHTDLWSPTAGAPSAFAIENGWDRLLAPCVPPWTRLGPVSPDVARATGLDAACAVLAGIHDSNASFLVHRAHRERPFSVVSTGTWVVAMACGGSLDGLREDRDTLAGVDAFGDATPTARFMGGREYAAIAGPDGLAARATDDDLRGVLASGALALPSWSDQGGPFAGRAGGIRGAAPSRPGARAALAALYCALMTDVGLDLVGARGPVVVEGRLASDPLFGRLVASLRPGQTVERSSDETGTLGGAALLARLPQRVEPPGTEGVAPVLPSAVRDHRARWRAACGEPPPS